MALLYKTLKRVSRYGFLNFCLLVKIQSNVSICLYSAVRWNKTCKKVKIDLTIGDISELFTLSTACCNWKTLNLRCYCRLNAAQRLLSWVQLMWLRGLCDQRIECCHKYFQTDPSEQDAHSVRQIKIVKKLKPCYKPSWLQMPLAYFRRTTLYAFYSFWFQNFLHNSVHQWHSSACWGWIFIWNCSKLKDKNRTLIPSKEAKI